LAKYFKYGAIFGAISAAATMLLFVFTVLFGGNPLGASKALGYLVMLSGVFLSMWYFRTRLLNGLLHFHQAFFLGLVSHLVACVLFGAFVWLYLSALNPDLLVRHRVEALAFLEGGKVEYIKTMGEAAYKAGMDSLASLSARTIAWDEAKKRFITLLFFILLASFIMRRSPNWALTQ
jgi:hypothetical protein